MHLSSWTEFEELDNHLIGKVSSFCVNSAKRIEMETTKLFVGGISWDTNEDRLREYFQNFGEVVEAVIMKDRVTGRARGFGFVVFADPAVAERVLLEKHIIDGRNVEAKRAVPRDDQSVISRNNASIHASPGPIRTKKIFVGGLASTVTANDFKNYFSQFGTITDVVVMYDHNTLRPRGFGFITYDSEEAVDRVLQRVFHELNGKMVEVKRAIPKELSPGPSRSPFSSPGGISRAGSFINGYNEEYSPNSVIGYGMKLDDRLSPISNGWSGTPQIGLGYRAGLNVDPSLNPGFAGNATFNSNFSYEHRMSPPYSLASQSHNSSVGYGVSSGGSSSIMSATGYNLWGNSNLNNNTANGARTGNTGLGFFGSTNSIGASSIFGQSSASLAFSNENTSSGSKDMYYSSRGGGYERKGVTLPSSFSTPSIGHYSDSHESASLYGDSMWRSLALEERSTPFSFGLGNNTLDVLDKGSTSYFGSYSVNRQAVN